MFIRNADKSACRGKKKADGKDASTSICSSLVGSSVARLLQRKCACGEHTNGGRSCAACAKTTGSATLHRAAISANTNEVPSIVHDVLRSSGQALDAQTRAYMEPRFGRDFSGVRIHTDARAAESARAVGAEAYTVGRDVVFGAHRHAPHSFAGRNLLAHELAHVVQQEHVTAGTAPTQMSQPSDAGEVSADQMSRAALSGESRPGVTRSSNAILSRQVIPRLVHCTAGTDGAPANPVDQLTGIVAFAEQMLITAVALLHQHAALTRAGNQPVGDPTDQAFNDRFGEPPDVAGGAMNRITGAVRPSRQIALSEEMDLMAGRYQMIADQLDQGLVHYLCMTTTRSFGGCTIGACTRDAFACPNVNAIFLCPGFWAGQFGTDSTLLIHETAHMIWERVFHGAGGSGGNFRHAECYASFVGDLFGLPGGEPLCPPT